MIGFVVGVLFGIALFLIRAHSTHSNSSLILAIGLSLFEMSAVVTLHWLARSFAEKMRIHIESLTRYNAKVALLKAAEQELVELQEKKLSLENEQTAFLDEVYARAHHHRQVERLVAAAKAAVRDGYLAGIAENQGKQRR